MTPEITSEQALIDEAPGPTDSAVLAHALQQLHISRDRYQSALARQHRLSISELSCLRHLEAHQPVQPTQLAEFLGVSRSAVTAMVDTLVRRGFAVRADHQADRRIVLISVTDQGAEIAGELSRELMSCLDLPTDEMDIVVTSISRISSAFDNCVQKLDANPF